jgi:hypothetical protein
MDSSQIETIAQRGRAGAFEQSARKRFVIAMREPWVGNDETAARADGSLIVR